MKNNIIDIKRTITGDPLSFVTLAEAKAQCIVTYSDDDTLITAYITKAIKAIENYCNISILAETIILTADLFTEWELPYGPVTGIQGVQTRSANEGSGPATYSTASTGWLTDGAEFLTFIPNDAGGFLSEGPFRGYFQWGPWASPYASIPGWNNRYKITYTTGYSTLPDDLKQAVLLQINFLYEHRGEEPASRYDWFPGVCEPAIKFADPYKRQSWL